MFKTRKSKKRRSLKTETVQGEMRGNLLRSHFVTPQVSHEVLDTMFVDFSKSLWHAFNSLGNGRVASKSRLKVIVSSIGRELGFPKAESVLDCNDDTEMDFLSFFSILKSEMLEKIKADSDESLLLTRPDFKEIHQVCWMLCSHKTLSRKDSITYQVDPITGVTSEIDENSCDCTEICDPPSDWSDDDAFKLWRVFNFFVDSDSVGHPSIPLRLDTEEAEYICNLFTTISGQVNKETDLHFLNVVKDEMAFDVFLNLFKEFFTSDLCSAARSFFINKLYENVVLDTLLKGTLFKHGYAMKNCKEYYFVLTSKELKYYLAPDENEMQKLIYFEDSWKIEVPEEVEGPRSHRFTLYTATKQFELSAHSFQKKYKWISVLQRVIEHNKNHGDDGVSIERQMAQERKTRREARREKEEIQFRSIIDQDALLEQSIKELDEERMATAMLQTQLVEERAMRLGEEARCKSLEIDLKTSVGQELEKREELQKLYNFKHKDFEAARFRRLSVEDEYSETFRLLHEARERIELLEEEKTRTLEALVEASRKLQEAEELRSKSELSLVEYIGGSLAEKNGAVSDNEAT